jgi:TonB family protein
MKRYVVPADLRGPLLVPPDPRLRRLLRVVLAAALVLALVLTFVPGHKPTFEPARLAPRPRTARVLEPKPPPPPRRVQARPPAPRPAEARASAPARGGGTAPEPEPAAVAARPSRTPTSRLAAKPNGPVGADTGQKGRAAAQQVAKDLAGTKANIDHMLAGLTGTVPAKAGLPAGAGGGSGTRKGSASQKYQVAGGRGSGEVGSIDAALGQSGAGSGGGTSRGVGSTGVDIVDDGVRSSGDADAISGRDSRSLMAVVQRYKAGVKFCYDNALKKTPGLAGKITLQLDIAPAGHVEKLAVVGNSMGNTALQRCIESQVRGWRFSPIGSGTVRFTLPLVFTPPE